MPTQSLFPTEIHTARMPASRARTLNPRLIREAWLHHEQDREGVRWSRKNYPAGYTSYSSMTDLPEISSNFRQLREWIDREVRKYVNTLELDLLGGRLQMTTCWVNIMGPLSHHSFHIHPLSVISGTYYLQVPKDSGRFRIEDPRLDAFMGRPPLKKNCRRDHRSHVAIDPEPGMLLLFESWLRHEVPANLGKSERISISFNYDWIRDCRD